MRSVRTPRCDWKALQLLAWVFLSPIGGCAPQPETQHVSGHVSYKGNPVARGVVTFFPAAGGRPFAGITNNEGHYQIRLPAGDYSVAVQPSANLPKDFKEGDPLPPPDPSAVPAEYRHQKKSGLTARVLKQPGPQEINFDLQ